MNKEVAIENLVIISNILRHLGITFWLEAGTCLGYVREGDFLSHDKDVDIGVYAETMATNRHFLALTELLLDCGFRLAHTFGTIDNGFEIAVIRNEVKVDIFWFYSKDDIRWHSAWLGNGSRKSDQLYYIYPKSVIDDLIQIKFKGNYFLVPRDTDTYLTTKYGNWKEVVKKWDWANSPLNKVEKI